MLKKTIAAAALLMLTACGAAEVDIAVVESSIQDKLGEGSSVECPDQVDWKTGGNFTCDVTDPDGAKAEATVTMDNDEGGVSWEIK